MTTGSAVSGRPAPDPATSGLEGIVSARTPLSEVDGLKGILTIRGYDIEEIASQISLEEAAYLLWHGKLPNTSELEEQNRRLVSYRSLPDEARMAVQAAAKKMEPMDALRFAVASLTVDDPAPGDISHEVNQKRAEMIVARVPIIVGMYQRLRSGGQVVEPRDDLGIAANLLYQMTGEKPSDAQVRGLETYLVTVTDHGMNASTFTTRVIASTASDMVSAVVGGIGALKGPLHGGAPGLVLEMLDAVGAPERAAAWLEAELGSGRRIMGMGHRIYRVRDPHAAVLEKAVETLEREAAPSSRLRLARAVEKTAEELLSKRHPERALRANVEFYTAVLLEAVGLPREAFTATFAVGRVAGWSAHVAEHRRVGKLIRPSSRYVGPRPDHS